MVSQTYNCQRYLTEAKFGHKSCDQVFDGTASSLVKEKSMTRNIHYYQAYIKDNLPYRAQYHPR